MNILLIQMKRIGDLILLSPVLDRLNAWNPEAHITLITNQASAGILPLLAADETLVFGKGMGGSDFWKHFLKARQGLHVCLDFSGNDRSALLTAISRAPLRASYSRFQEKPFRKLAYNRFIDSSVAKRHTADHHLDLLAALDIPFQETPLKLHVSQKYREDAQYILKKHGVTSDYAIIHPGTARAEKYWTSDAWARVAEELYKKYNLQIVMTGAPDPHEAKHRAEIQHRSKAPLTSLAEKLSLPQLAAVLENAKILIGVDSAPCHMADGLGCPTIALFGPTNPFHWRPRGKNSHVVTPENKTWDGPKWSHPEMKKLRVEDVLAKIEKLEKL
ncbi:MAG: glycosyltransferase family 9 protein [Chthoniobacterales bacterium]